MKEKRALRANRSKANQSQFPAGLEMNAKSLVEKEL